MDFVQRTIEIARQNVADGERRPSRPSSPGLRRAQAADALAAAAVYAYWQERNGGERGKGSRVLGGTAPATGRVREVAGDVFGHRNRTPVPDTAGAGTGAIRRAGTGPSSFACRTTRCCRRTGTGKAAALGRLRRVNAPLVLLDSASLYFRAYFAQPDSLTAADGTSVNAVRGFTDTVARVLSDRRPKRLVACLDADWRPQFRVDLLPSYKAHRVAVGSDGAEEEVPDTLSPQVPIILDVLAAAGIATGEAAGFEADDVIGTLTTGENTDPVEVITGDRDLFQLVRAEPTRVRVIYNGRGWAKAETLDEQALAAKYGLPGHGTGKAYLDMSIMRGDPSDGLPGVAGIGEKTAAKLITEHGSLQALIELAADPGSPFTAKMRQRFLDATDYLAVAPKVVAVAADAGVELSTSDTVPEVPADEPALRELQQRWNLGGSVDRLIAALNG